MDFTLSDEQRLLQETLTRLVAKDYDFERRQGYAKQPDGWSRAMWARYAEMGLLGLPFAARHGGMGCGPVETMLVMEALGRALVVEPYVATVILAGSVLRAEEEFAGVNLSPEAKVADEWIPRIASGTATLALAHAEPKARHDLAFVECAARRDGDQYVLDGRKCVVVHGASADRLIVSARLSGGPSAREGVALFLVDPKLPGVTLKRYATQDGLFAADVTLAQVRVPAACLIGAGAGIVLLEHMADFAIAALAAEAVGAMSAAFELTVEYLKVRQQFGQPLGRFQALQHRAAEMQIALEQARSMAIFAALMVDEADVGERRKALSAVKVQIGRSGRFIGQQAIQLHGGIGVTEEYAVGHYFKRLTMIEHAFGDTQFHLARFARTGGYVAAS
ncbi:MAG TPA: acyl-CoA dehydrogenase family protein [Burkholderiaceae bacterium]|nr:acyl-CoA dehydrogenase family protein [Burkholderiaceae bacterium]